MDQGYPENAIAIIGMGCKFPGAESLEEYWKILLEGTSMCCHEPPERFRTTNTRNQNKSIYSGNFISSIDSFDHKFFRKSSREAASMDPQQRLLLEVAYQTLESAGYFGQINRNTDIGCYVGVCASDYNDNVASHPPNAFSTLGTLRAFLTGKISHFFGWSGPSVSFDTACSSSAVAIDAACKAIQLGSCHSAVAGGVSLFTSPYFFQNLSAASFLSPTGATKSFDADADGYSRGEGVGLVMLKKLSDALADNDHIFGVLMSTAVNQSSNLVPITVPYSPSQTALYRKILDLANVSPLEVTYLEAHGTGTRIGDPQEYEGIKQVFGCPERQESLYFASVKGNIGHTEGASGVAGLIKTVLMMQKGVIVRQASFKRLNPKIMLGQENLAIPTASLKWTAKTLIACVNNYGAAGSIAAMVVKQPPRLSPANLRRTKSLTRYPIYLSANSPESLGAYATKLREFIAHLPPSTDCTLADLACNLNDKQNQSLSYAVATTVSTMKELDDQLRIVASVPGAPPSYQAPDKPKPVILVFGGQTNRYIGLNKMVLETSPLVRHYLDECDAILRSFGSDSIYPGIFATEARDDIVTLQTMQFALQYSVAMAWIRSGIHVDCVLGHSFGQLVALTVCGSLSLNDGLKLVHGRAVLMSRNWGLERGCMIALDATVETAHKLIASARTSDEDALEVACYNGPSSQVVVGSEAAITDLTKILDQSTGIRYKKLDVTHGFHSQFIEPILEDLRHLAGTLTFNEPKISLETCSENSSWANVTPTLIAEHSRIPVYFGQAVSRIVRRFGPCTWLEAGSNSSIVSMARRALCDDMSKHSFFPINLSRDDAMGSLADTVVNLSKNGHNVHFWPFDRFRRGYYAQLNLPPYQFEKTKHWLDFVDAVPSTASEVSGSPLDQKETKPPKLLSFIGFNDHDRGQAIFCIEPRCEEWRRLVEGHAVLGNPLCPAPLYVELASRAIATLRLESSSDTSCPLPALCLKSLEIATPLGVCQNGYVKLVLSRMGVNEDHWNAAFFTTPRQYSFMDNSADTTLHASGVIATPDEAEIRGEFARTERLIPYQRIEDHLTRTDGEGMNGSLVYRVFSRVVQYSAYYKGVSQVVAKDDEVIAQVTLQQPELLWAGDQVSKPLAMDNFLQVAGIHVNCLRSCNENDVFVCTKVARILLSADFAASRENRGDWRVFSTLHTLSEKEVENDVYVFDATTRRLVVIVLGARFNRVLITSLAKVLARANGEEGVPKRLATPELGSRTSDVPTPATLAPVKKTTTSVLEKELRQLLCRITDVPENEFKGEATLEELGIDSLMVTEIVAGVSEAFKVEIPQSDLQDLLTFRSLCDYLARRGACDDVVHEDTPIVSVPESISLGEGLERELKAPSASHKQEIIKRIAQLVASHLEFRGDLVVSTNLADQGLDSLLCMELASDIERLFSVKIDVTLLTTESTFGDLCDIVIGSGSTSRSSTADDFFIATPGADLSTDTEEDSNSLPESQGAKLGDVQHAFEAAQNQYEIYANETGFRGFWKNVFPEQSRLVLAYVVETFEALGCSLKALQPGDQVPELPVLSKHSRLKGVFYEVLREGQLVGFTGSSYIRSEHALDPTPSHEIYTSIIREYPQHAKEHELLNVCGSIMPSLVTGKRDPLQLLFGTKKNKELLEEVYRNGPMYLAVTRMLGSFLENALQAHEGGRINVLEIGAGTGATTRWVVDVLTQAGIEFTYTFSDISPSLVAAAKRKFSKYSNMRFIVLDIEKNPPAELARQFHTILSTNCIHATRNLAQSLTHIHQMLHPGGFVSLVEFTKNMFWFDLVFGLLEGWWLFSDGREHVLADEAFWEQSMKAAGFHGVAMTEGSSLEANTVRIINGYTDETVHNSKTESWVTKKEAVNDMETIVYNVADDKTILRADIYYPAIASKSQSWPIALLIHGGGHTMLSRKDIHPKQVQYLLRHHILPVSVDYRLCPETTLIDGPIRDVKDAFIWARTKLASLNLRASCYLDIDSSRVGVVGWSTGGTLAMSLSWTLEGFEAIQPPDTILSFYCPTDYEDPFWQEPNFPNNSKPYAGEEIDLLDGVFKKPITAYNVPPSKRATGGWMCPTDPRSRIILHMNWHGQTLPVLCNGLPAKDAVLPKKQKEFESLPQPPREQIAEISPYAQISRGKSRSPTYLIHGTNDDLIPWQQSQRTYEALKEAGIPAGISILEGQPHLFDLFSDATGEKQQAVEDAYAFIFKHLRVGAGASH
ncbi:Type I Iterative PKS [Arthroderma sp. PD_2]|nr:Type I Iterative PKS [Arthroderma sp. PD_2]